MTQTIETASVNECESALDNNWNERKHLIDQEFDLRLEIQATLVKQLPGFAALRQKEQECKNALERNEREYESLVVKWANSIELPPLG